MKFNNIVDRKKYLHRGTWRNPDQDVDHVFYYYFVQPMTMTVGTQFGRETIRPTCVVGIFGQHPFVKGDTLTLENGLQLQVGTIRLEYFENNIVARDKLLPKVMETVVSLQ